MGLSADRETHSLVRQAQARPRVMKSVHRVCLSAALVGMILFASGRTFGQAIVGAPTDSEFKFSTPAAAGIAVPYKIESSIGTLNPRYGYPKPDTVEKIYDNLDRSRALQAYLMAIPIVNQAGMRDSLRSTCDQVHQCLGHSCQQRRQRHHLSEATGSALS